MGRTNVYIVDDSAAIRSRLVDMLIVELDGTAARRRKHMRCKLRRTDVLAYKAAAVVVHKNRAQRG